jgi:predicted AAA+ superfamily ATPase
LIRLDVPGEAAAFRADPDAVLRGMTVREQLGRVAAEPLIDRLARGAEIAVPGERLDLRDYLDLALRSGFPEALDIGGAAARQRWLEGYVDQIITRDPTGTVGARNPALLLRYLKAYALHSAGIVEAKSLYEAAGIDKRTATSYENVLENVFVAESLPAWRTNRLKRLAQAPKRYVLDAGLMAAILRVDMAAILRDDKLLGRVVDTFVASQLRGEIEVCATRPRLYHLRDTDGRREADIVAELSGERVLGFEVKASSSVTSADARHLAWMRDELGDRFVGGVVFHAGPHAFPLGDRITALPISAIWAAQ